MTNTEKEKPVKLGGMQAHTRGLFNKGIGSEGTCSTAAATAAKEVTLGTTFDLVSKATILVTFTNGISVANATLAVTHTDLAGNTTTEEAKAINYRGSALAADLVKSGDKVLLRYDGTAFNVIGVLDQDLSSKQDVINDLSDIRSGASAGATAYQKPSGGIPKTDLVSDVQTSLGKADSAYQKPSGGIPASDLAFTPATLTDGKVPSSQLPSYVDDVIEGYLKKTDGKFYAHKSGSTYTDEITGETGKIYVDLNTNKSYRWSGSAFVEISSSDVTGIKVGSSGTTITPSEGVITIPAYEEGAQVHIAPTATEVKSALGTGSGTSKYLREDGTWQTPTDNNTTYKFTIGTTTNGDATNGVDLGTLKSEAAAASGTTLSLVTTGEKATWNAKTSNTGTVTKVIAGTGLTGGDITTSGTIALATSGATAGTYKSVTVDAYGRVTGGTNPTTLSGYGITDAKIASGTITLGSNTITPLTSHQDISGKADKSATVSTVTYDTTNKKLTKTINGTTTDVVTSAKIVEDGGGNLVKLNVIELESLAHNYSFKVNDAMYVGAALYKCTAATTKPPFNFVFDSNNSIVVDRINGQDAVVCDSDTLNTGWEKVVEINDRYYIEQRLLTKADKATTLAGYNIGDAYTKTQIDALTRHTRLTDFDLNVLKQAVADQNLEKYGLKVGDQKTINGYTYIIAGLNCMKGVDSASGNNDNHVGLIVLPHATEAWSEDNPITNGCAASNLMIYLRSTVLPQAETDLGTGNLVTRNALLTNTMNPTGSNNRGNANDLGCTSGYVWASNQSIFPLSEVQVIGTTVFSSSAYDVGEACQQLEVFKRYRYTEIFRSLDLSTHESVWTRAVASNTRAVCLDGTGDVTVHQVTSSKYVAGLVLFK